MDRAMIISGKNRGKSGDLIGMFFGAGICVVKADDGNEYVAKLDEIRKVYPVERHNVIGLPKEMVKEIEKNCGISICANKGEVWFYELTEYREYEPSECEELFIEALETEYGIILPDNYILFAADGNQKFDFYIGIMF